MIDVVAIDGPVGVGKSSVASRLAARLGWLHLDTGAMYRAVTLLAMRAGVPTRDEPGCLALARSMELAFLAHPAGQRVVVAGEDVSEAIREPAVARAVSDVADQRGVREELGRRQRAMGAAAPSVAEGRDMGTVVFPDARWKFHLDADPLERARRRGDQLALAGKIVPEAELLRDIADRDRRDRERPVGALRVAADATILDSTDIPLDRVVLLMETIVRADLDLASS